MAKTIDDIQNFFASAPTAFSAQRAQEDSDRAAKRKAEDDDLIAKRKAEDAAIAAARATEDADIATKRQAVDAEYADFTTAAATIKSQLAALPVVAS